MGKSMDVEMDMDDEGEKDESKKYGKYEDYDIESAVRTLNDADAIKADKEKMKYVLMCMKEKMNNMDITIKSLDDLKAVAKKKSMEA